jgi:hypothetical protein
MILKTGFRWLRAEAILGRLQDIAVCDFDALHCRAMKVAELLVNSTTVRCYCCIIAGGENRRRTVVGLVLHTSHLRFGFCR